MVIKAPEPPKIKTSKDGRDAAGAGEQKPEFDGKAYKRRLAAVAAKEKRAAALMQKAKAESEKILQHAKNETASWRKPGRNVSNSAKTPHASAMKKACAAARKKAATKRRRR